MESLLSDAKAQTQASPVRPVRDGVPASCVVLPSVPCTSGLTVLDGLAQRLPAVDRAGWLARLQAGDVLDGQGQPVAAHTPYRNGLRLHYWRSLPDEAPVPFDHRVLFADAHLVVADKPHFLPVTPAGRHVEHTLLVRLQRELGLPELSPIHRIDRETAGLVVFAVRPQDRNAYQALFRERRVDKVYEAMAPAPQSGHGRRILGQPWVHRSHLCEDEHAFFKMRESPPGEGTPPNSQTTVELVAQRGLLGLYRLYPLTGKRHQLRVHMSAQGTPIHGDLLYPVVRQPPGAAPNTTDPLRLLAKNLTFTDPLSGEKRSFQSTFELKWPDAAP